MPVAVITSERIARNEAAFRGVNEKIERRAQRIAGDLPAVPFICECPRPLCTLIIVLTIADYEEVRSQGTWFLVAPGHETCVVDGEEVARVAKRYEQHWIMEKVGRAGEVAEELDPRSE